MHISRSDPTFFVIAEFRDLGERIGDLRHLIPDGMILKQRRLVRGIDDLVDIVRRIVFVLRHPA